VDFYASTGTFVTNTTTTASGAYQVSMAAGTYYARTSNSQGYVDQLFNGVPCATVCTLTSGTPISVVLGAVTSNVDFVLGR
jgi:hypothetical protein